jgi:hypothetical protein
MSHARQVRHFVMHTYGTMVPVKSMCEERENFLAEMIGIPRQSPIWHDRARLRRAGANAGAAGKSEFYRCVPL